MDDLNRQLRQFLSDPRSMEQLQSMAATLGLGDVSLAGDLPPAGDPPSAGKVFPGNGASPDLFDLAARLAPLLGQLDREDDAARLLKALRPFLSGARQQKLDEALKLLQILRLLPLLRETGLLPGIL